MKVLDLFCCEGGATQGYIDGGLELLAGIDLDPKHIDVYNDKFSDKGHVMSWEDGLKKYGEKADLIHASPPCQLFSSQSRDRLRDTKGHLNLIPDVDNALHKLGKPYVIENVERAKGVLEETIERTGGSVIKLVASMFPEDLKVDWTPPLSRTKQTIKDDSYPDPDLLDANRRHWFKCKCEKDEDGNKKKPNPAYYCHVVPESKIPTEWTIKRERYFKISSHFQITSPDEQEIKREVMSITVSSNPTMVWNKINRRGVPLWVRQKVMGDVYWMTDRGVGECIPPPYTREIARQFLEGQRA